MALASGSAASSLAPPPKMDAIFLLRLCGAGAARAGGAGGATEAAGAGAPVGGRAAPLADLPTAPPLPDMRPRDRGGALSAAGAGGCPRLSQVSFVWTARPLSTVM